MFSNLNTYLWVSLKWLLFLIWSLWVTQAALELNMPNLHPESWVQAVYHACTGDWSTVHRVLFRQTTASSWQYQWRCSGYSCSSETRIHSDMATPPAVSPPVATSSLSFDFHLFLFHFLLRFIFIMTHVLQPKNSSEAREDRRNSKWKASAPWEAGLDTGCPSTL